MRFLDIFGNELNPGDFIAFGSSGIQIYLVEKLFIDKHGYKKLRVVPVTLDDNATGGFVVGTKKKYVWDNYNVADKSDRIILLRRP